MCFLLQCLLDLHFQVSCVMVEAKPAAGQSVGWSLWPSEPFCWQGLDVDNRNSLTPQRRCGSFWFHFAQLHEGFLPYAVIFPELLEFVAFLFEQLVMFVSSDTEGKQHLTQRPAGWNITPFQSTAMHLKAADLCWSAFWVCCVLAVSWSWRRGHVELPLCTARAALSCTSCPHAGGTRQVFSLEDVSKFLVCALALGYTLQLS